MIVLSICILLTILLVANIALSIYNRVYPPCNTLDEYFTSAKILPKDRTKGLDYTQYKSRRNMQNTQPVDYVSVDQVTEKKSNKNNHVDQGYLESKLDVNKDMTGSSFYKELDKMFTPKNQEQETPKKGVSGYNGERIALFDVEMEGVGAKIARKRSDSDNSLVRIAERDGYGDRDPANI